MSDNHSLPRSFDLLLVEDSEDDVYLTKRAFARLTTPINLHVAGDGVDALKFLRHEAPFADAPTPALILLDLNMPRMDGRQLLAELKHDPSLQLIPAIVLSTSTVDRDVCDAYRAHASAYMTKPVHPQKLAHQTQAMIDFWLNEVAVLPSQVS